MWLTRASLRPGVSQRAVGGQSMLSSSSVLPCASTAPTGRLSLRKARLFVGPSSQDERRERASMSCRCHAVSPQLSTKCAWLGLGLGIGIGVGVGLG